MARKGPNKLTI